jgi:hypothetical protein
MNEGTKLDMNRPQNQMALTKMFRMEFPPQRLHTAARNGQLALGTDGALAVVEAHLAQETAMVVEEGGGGEGLGTVLHTKKKRTKLLIERNCKKDRHVFHAMAHNLTWMKARELILV